MLQVPMQSVKKGD